jgi:hypothetical protein
LVFGWRHPFDRLEDIRYRRFLRTGLEGEAETTLSCRRKAYRNARRRGGRQQEWHWTAVRDVIQHCPEMSRREANQYAGHIIRYVSLYYRKWFWG